MNKSVALNDVFPLIEEMLESGGNASFITKGTSMLPLLRDGKNKVYLSKPTELKKRDIIFYRRDDGTFILHRIIKIKKGGFVCRGDNQTLNEYPVSPESVIAVLTHYEKDGVKKSVDSFSFKFYSFFWVKTVVFRKIYRNTINFLRRMIK